MKKIFHNLCYDFKGYESFFNDTPCVFCYDLKKSPFFCYDLKKKTNQTPYFFCYDLKDLLVIMTKNQRDFFLTGYEKMFFTDKKIKPVKKKN